MSPHVTQIALLAPMVLIMVSVAACRGELTVSAFAAIYLGFVFVWWTHR